MFSDIKISQNISAAVAQTAEDGREQIFLSSLTEDGKIFTNDLYQGDETSVGIHLPSLGESDYIHPKGRGMFLEPGDMPYLLFHTHPTNERTSMSPADLEILFNLAKQNFILADDSTGYWINPSSLVASTNGDLKVYQIDASIIEKYSQNDSFMDIVGQCALDYGKKLGLPDAIEAAENAAFPGDIFKFLENGSLVSGTPSWLVSIDHIDEVYAKAGIKSQAFDFDSNKLLIDQMPEVPVMVEFKNF